MKLGQKQSPRENSIIKLYYDIENIVLLLCNKERNDDEAPTLFRLKEYAI